MTDEELIARWDDYVERMGSVMGEVEHMAQQMRDRIERLEAALRFYADQNTYETQYEQRSCGCCTDIFEPINEDKGAKARAALKQEKPHDRA